MAQRTFGCCTKQISQKELRIPVCDGTRSLMSEEVNGEVPFHLDVNLSQKRLTKRQPATLDVSTVAYRLVKDVTFIEMFGSLSRELELLCLTQHQIRVFCLKHRKYLAHPHSAVFFLNKQDCHLYVVAVSDFETFMYGAFYKLKDREVWRAEREHRIIVPQIVR